MEIIASLIIGAIAGWLAGLIVKGYGFGLLGNMAIGVVGAFIGGWLFGHFGVFPGGGLIGALIGATVGAVILLLLLRLIRRTVVQVLRRAGLLGGDTTRGGHHRPVGGQAHVGRVRDGHVRVHRGQTRSGAEDRHVIFAAAAGTDAAVAGMEADNPLKIPRFPPMLALTFCVVFPVADLPLSLKIM